MSVLNSFRRRVNVNVLLVSAIAFCVFSEIIAAFFCLSARCSVCHRRRENNLQHYARYVSARVHVCRYWRAAV